MPTLNDILLDHRIDIEVRYKALIAICTTCHNNLDYSALEGVLKRHRSEFRHYKRLKLFDTIPSQQETVDQFLTSLDVLDQLGSEMQSDPNFLYHYAELVVFASDAYEKLPNRDRLLERARTFLNRAISIERYPKYLSLLGHTLLLQGEYAGAKAYLKQAIDTEDSLRADYSIRLQRYHQTLGLVELRRTANDLTKRVSVDMDNKLRTHEDAVRGKQVEFIGFFVAIMSFVITGFGLARNYSALEASQLIFVTGSCLVAAVTGFSILTSSSLSSRRLTVQIAAGLCVSLLLFLTAIAAIPRTMQRQPASDPRTPTSASNPDAAVPQSAQPSTGAGSSEKQN